MNTICQIIGLAPSSYYYQPSPSDTAELEAALLRERWGNACEGEKMVNLGNHAARAGGLVRDGRWLRVSGV